MYNDGFDVVEFDSTKEQMDAARKAYIEASKPRLIKLTDSDVHRDGFDVVEFDVTKEQMVAARKAYSKATHSKLFKWTKKTRLAWARYLDTLFNFVKD